MIVVGQLGTPEGSRLADAARDAFNGAAARGYLVVAAIELIAAAWAWRALRHGPDHA